MRSGGRGGVARTVPRRWCGAGCRSSARLAPPTWRSQNCPPPGRSRPPTSSRVNVGSTVTEAAYALVDRAARGLLATGTYAAVAGGIPRGEFNVLMLPQA
ncbi:hypothetical protein ABT275_43725 [Streptomyces sp. NPDC001185]|uniref:hypothetical protein n=1 Tax=Streptomyces sp. NPDC001185 TaxID=3154380 RepID=UPI00331AD092